MKLRGFWQPLNSGPAVLLLGTVLSLSLLAAGYWYWISQRADIEHLARENLTAVYAGRASAIGDWMKERKGDGRQVFEKPRLRRLLANPDNSALRVELENWMQSMRRDYGYDALILLDHNYDRVIESPVEAWERFACQSLHRDGALQTRDVGISDIHRSSLDGTIHLSITVPIGVSDQPGEPAAGLMMMVINPENFLFPLIQSWPFKSESSESLLVRREGNEVVFLNELRHQKDTALQLRFPLDHPELPAALSYSSETISVYDGLDYRGVPVLAATGPVPGTPWNLIAKTDEAEAYQRLNQSTRSLSIQLGLVMCVLWLAAFAVWRRGRFERVEIELEQQRKSESAARTAAMRMKLATETTGLGVWEWHVSEGRMLWDEQMFQIYGIESTQDCFVDYEAWKNMVLPEDRPQRELVLRAARAGQSGKPVEFRIRRPDNGEIRYLVSVHASSSDKLGREKLVIGTSLDVTDRKRNEDLLREHMTQIQLATEVSGVGIWQWNVRTNELKWDDQMPVIYGASTNTSTIDEWKSAVLPEDLPEQLRILKRTVATKGTSQREFRITRANDQKVRILQSAETVRLNAAGEVEWIIGSNIDITELRQAEDEIYRLSTVVEQSPLSIVIANLAGNIEYTNPHFSTATGYSAAEVKGQNPRVLKSGESSPEVYEKLWKTITAGRTWKGIFRNRRKDGGLFWEEAVISPLSNHCNEVTGYLAIKTDVSERIRAEQKIHEMNHDLEGRVEQRTHELKLANQELESFSYSVSHDLRAPLRAIDGWAQVLLDDFAPVLVGEGKTALDRLRAATQRMGTLIDDLLRLSRINRQDLEPAPVEMARLVGEVVQELEAAEAGDVSTISVGPLADGEGSISLLRQVWANLISNALKFTTKVEAPEILVGSRIDSDGDRVYFVRDNGAGFDMSFAHKLFGAFQRLHSAREFPGTGIGLALSQRIIHRHGGRIWATGEVGIGAEFCFTLGPTGIRAPLNPQFN